MNILVTGANGQLGKSIQKCSIGYPTFRFLYSDLPEVDITDLDAMIRIIRDKGMNMIINCAAYTAVDQAEKDQQSAFLVNETGPATLAEACRITKSKLIHISTDYVFSGTSYRPYTTDEETEPQSVYAKSKAAGELAVMESGAEAWIIRTSWLYSEFGNNFVKTMLRLGREKELLHVVSDQIGSPTYAGDLADAILKLIAASGNTSSNHSGTRIYHYANSGIASWFDFCHAIMEMAQLPCQVSPIQTEDYPLPAKRPFYSVLDTSAIVHDLKLSIPYWRSSLYNCISILLNQKM